jgi:hypothetical protein
MLVICWPWRTLSCSCLCHSCSDSAGLLVLALLLVLAAPDVSTHPDAVDGLQVEGGDTAGGIPEGHVRALGRQWGISILWGAVQVQHLVNAHLQDNEKETWVFGGVDMIQSERSAAGGAEGCSCTCWRACWPIQREQPSA